MRLGALERSCNKHLEKSKSLSHQRTSQGTQPSKLPSPQPGPQTLFLNTDADIAFFGGSAGGGKTLALLLDFAREECTALPGYGGVIFRRTYPQIRNEGGLWDEASKWYPSAGAQPLESRLEWKFPAGATVRFAHLQHEKNVYDWQGAQIARIGFDEITHFTESQFWYLLSRARTTIGIKPVIRGTCNPDADSWVAKMVDWWIDENGFPIAERSGVLRWFVRIAGELIWADDPDELRSRHPDTEPKSFTFIPAKISDNPILLDADPSYLANLMAQHPTERARLLDGNWKVRFEAGTIFNREWFEIVDSVPAGGVVYSCWDIAATDKAVAKKSSFYSARVKGCRVGNVLYIMDVYPEQVGPGEVAQLMLKVAQQDGKDVQIRWELEGGSSGKIVEDVFGDVLAGFNRKAVKPVGSKVERATPLATDAAKGLVKLLRGPWNDMFLGCAQSFDGSPQPLVNDVIDATTQLDHVAPRPLTTRVQGTQVTPQSVAHPYSQIFR